jgi:hypothetical protein
VKFYISCKTEGVASKQNIGDYGTQPGLLLKFCTLIFAAVVTLRGRFQDLRYS